MSTTQSPAPAGLDSPHSQLQPLFQRRQEIQQELEQNLQELAKPHTAAELQSLYDRQNLLTLEKQNINNQVAHIESQQAPQVTSYPTQQEFNERVLHNIDFQAAQAFQELQRPLSLSEFNLLQARDSEHQERRQRMTREQLILDDANLLNEDLTLKRPLTPHDRDVLNHSLQKPDAISPALGIAFGN
jgi:hypothetical protein